MAMASAMTSDGGQDDWSYVYEALQNVRCLQLLLFHRALSPVRDCLNFTAVVCHGSLHCAWDSPDGTPSSLSVSLPACLLDLSLPVRCWTRQDHVEVRLGLLSLDPALYMLQLSLEDGGSGLNACNQVDLKPFSVDFDAQALESNEGVQIFCGKCSCKLTNSPFRRVLEVPSMDWREVSEHFYGNCCCASFGAQAEFLVARFQQLLTPSEETCLIASTTCIVHKGNVIVSEGDVDTFSTKLPETLEIDSKDGGEETALVVVEEYNQELGSTCKGALVTSSLEKAVEFGDNATYASIKVPLSQNYINRVQGGKDTSSRGMLPADGSVADGRTTVSVAEERLEACYSGNKFLPDNLIKKIGSKSHQETEEDPCCSSSCSFRKPASTEFSGLKEAKDASPESLGNGFMTGPGSQSEVLDWEPFFCRSCSSLVGARRGNSSKKGVQFFKCKISTNESVSSTSNIFREHTLEKLFTHELEKNTESNSSYRYVVRSFRTGAALLQLVLLNQSALVGSGTCLLTSTLNTGDAAMNTTTPTFLDGISRCQIEDAKSYQTLDRKPAMVSLKTVAKFMFCDCRMLDSEQLKLIDKWAKLQKADEIFMLDEVAGTLVDLLKLHQLTYPPSCQLFQQFGLSFLTK